MLNSVNQGSWGWLRDFSPGAACWYLRAGVGAHILTLNQLSCEDKYKYEFEPSSYYRGWWNLEVLGVFVAQQAIIIINGDYFVIDAVGRKLFLLHPLSWAESIASEHGLGDCGGDLMPSSRTLVHFDLLEREGPNLVPFCSRSGFRPFFIPHYFTVIALQLHFERKEKWLM